MMQNGGIMPGGGHDHAGGSYQYHEASQVTAGLSVNLIASQPVRAGQAVKLTFQVLDLPACRLNTKN
jgi:hypothetical protein